MANHQDKKGRSKNPEGQFALLPYSMLKSPPWRSLGGSAIKVFFELHTRFHGANNGDLSLGLDEAARTLGMSWLHMLGPYPLSHFLRELERGADISETLERYASLPACFIKAYDGNRFPPSLHSIGGRAEA